MIIGICCVLGWTTWTSISQDCRVLSLICAICVLVACIVKVASTLRLLVGIVNPVESSASLDKIHLESSLSILNMTHLYLLYIVSEAVGEIIKGTGKLGGLGSGSCDPLVARVISKGQGQTCPIPRQS